MRRKGLVEEKQDHTALASRDPGHLVEESEEHAVTLTSGFGRVSQFTGTQKRANLVPENGPYTALIPSC